MGCGGSAAVGQTTAEDKRRIIQPKVPILLFYLPGPVRETFARIVMGSSPQKEEAEGALNLRLIDVQNTRNARRYWVKELQNRNDFAAAYYLADLRDHPTMLLAARTLNWFLRLAQKTYDVKVVTIYEDEAQIEEFQSYLPKGIEITKLCEKRSDLVASVIEMLRNVEQRYLEQKRYQNTKTGTKSV